MKEGDLNTGLFHRMANGRKKRNTINKIIDEVGIVHRKEDMVKKVFVDYFLGLFTTKSELNMTQALEAVEHRVTDEMSKTLSQPFTAEEVATVLSHPCQCSSWHQMNASYKSTGS